MNKKRIAQSVHMALFATALTSSLAALAALALNDRFIDSMGDGWLVFLVLPLVAAVPAALVAFLAGFLPQGGGKHQGDYFLSLVTALIVLPAGLYLIRNSLSGLLAGSGGLTGAVLIACARWWPVVTLLVFLALLPLLGVRLSTRPIGSGEKPITLFFCMDGANWAIIDPLVEGGELPAFRALQKEGVRFDMESTGPLMSPILWTTIATGVPASVHNVQSFYATSATVNSPRIWDMVEQCGGTVGLLGWPITWPPRKVDGFLIPSLFARGPETWPEELSFIREIAMREKGKRSRDFGSYLTYGIRSVQFGVRLSTLRTAVDVITDNSDFYESMSAKRFLKLRMHGDIFIELLERYRPDFAAFYNNSPDVLSHYFWKFFEPDAFADVSAEEASRYGGTIPDAYRMYDAAMGRILRYMPENANIVVLSDHGLEATETMGTGTTRLILTEKFLDILGLAETIQGINLASRVYLRPKGGSGRIPEELALLVGDVVLAGTNEAVFRTTTDEWDNLIVEVKRKLSLEGKSLRVPGRPDPVPVEEMIEETNAGVSGEHNPNAIFLVKGDAIRKGARGGDATIFDVAPTALFLMGYPIHDPMVGKVLENAFIDGWVRNHPPQRKLYDMAEAPVDQTAETGDENLKDVLKSLGYLND